VTRVLVDTTYLARGHTGTGTYVRQLLRALRALGVEVGEASNPRRRPPGTGSLRNAAADAWWARVELPRLARRGGYDLVHHPLPAHSPGVRNVVTVHDLAFDVHPELFARGFATWARIAHARPQEAGEVEERRFQGWWLHRSIVPSSGRALTLECARASAALSDSTSRSGSLAVMAAAVSNSAAASA